MAKNFYIHLSFALPILHTILFPITFCFPFYNLQSARLQNGNFIFVHKYGVDIVNHNVSKIIRHEISFTEEEQITVEKMKDVIIKLFDDGYVICLMNDQMYIFDEAGNFKQKKEDANNNMAYNYYSLNVKDNHHYFVAFTNIESLNVYYYEYDKTANTITNLGDFAHFKFEVPVRRLEEDQQIKYYSLIGGINCHMMYTEVNGEALVCFFILSYNDQYYWNIAFYDLDSNYKIISHATYSPLKKLQDVKITYFKVAVNSNKDMALICGFAITGDDLCFHYSIIQTEIIYNYEYMWQSKCLYQYDAFKVNYFSEKNEFVFSCLDENVNTLEKIKYVFFYLDYSNQLKWEYNIITKTDECDKFNGFDVFYSQTYFIITDYICNKIDESVEEEVEKEKEKEEESKAEEEVIKEEQTSTNVKEEEKKSVEEETNKEEETTKESDKKEEEEEESAEEEKIEEKEFECQLEKCSKCNRESSSKNLYESCNELNGYYSLKNSPSSEEQLYKDCFNETTKPINYYFDDLEKYYMPCFETCKTCKYGGDSQINNCTSCAFGYTFIPGLINTTNCITKCPYFHYYTSYGQYKCSEVSVCPEDYYLLIREKNKCIDNCTKDDEYKYQYNGECYKQCPSDSKDNDDYICKDNNINICSLSQRNISVASQTITEQEKENLAKSYVKEFSYTDNHISFFDYGNSEIIFYKNYECVSDLGLEIPKVDLGDC